MDRGELISYLRVHLAGGVGAVRFRRLLDVFGDCERIARAGVDELMRVEGVGAVTARRMREGFMTVDPEGELRLAEQAGVRVITFDHEEYPQLLRNSARPPAVLYVKGELRDDDQLAIAVVGTRRASRYGAEQARRFGRLLAQAGFVVVSGLARGIDAEAHRGALEAGGRTVAVLGNGLSQVYPPEHESLARTIVSGSGALISELPMRMEPEAGSFPARNRIIAAMSLGTLVIEAPGRSGALITARLACDYNREVFAVPGPVDMRSMDGSHELIRSGRAKLVSSLDDILDELNEAGSMMKSRMQACEAASGAQGGDGDEGRLDGLGGAERAIWEFLRSGANDVEAICQFCGLSAGEASAGLTLLEIKGFVRQLPGNQYSRR